MKQMLLSARHNILKKKAQVGIELVIIIGALLMFMLFFLGIIGNNTLEKNRQKQDILTEQTAMNVRDEIALAFKSSNGYWRVFEVPQKIGNKEYNITLVDGFVYVISNDQKNSIALPIENVTGNIVKGQNTIKKINGTIYLNF